MFDPSDYKIPGSNALTLSPELARDIKERFSRDRDNRFHIFLIAAGMRKKYLVKSENKKDAYSSEFRMWYTDNGMPKLFGQLESSFVKYAAAGAVIQFVADGGYLNSEDRLVEYGPIDTSPYLDALPVTVTALYELSLIKEKIDGKTFRALFTCKPTRKSLNQNLSSSQTDEKHPVIHPHATASELALWLKNWGDPPQPTLPRSDKRTLMLAAITVSGELFDFAKDGEHIGKVKLEEVKDCINRLRDLVSELNMGDQRFLVLDNFDYLDLGYTSREERAQPEAKVKFREERKKLKEKHKRAVEKAKAAGKQPPKPPRDKPADPKKLRALNLSKINGIIK